MYAALVMFMKCHETDEDSNIVPGAGNHADAIAVPTRKMCTI